MKSFIVVALLVASVASQSLDMYKPLNKDLLINSRKGLMFNNNRQLNGLKNYYPYGGEYSNMINDGDYYPTYNYGDDDTYINVLQYDEIVAQPLFREYMTLPLFRQYWSYPMFQRFVCSHYFQQWWTVPAYKQYFIQPTLFYKYIYPIVQLFKYDYSTVNTFTGRDFWAKNVYPMGDYYQGQQQQFNYGGLPTVCYTNSVYCRALIQKLYNHLMYTTKMIAPDTTSMEMNADYYKYNPYYARMMYPNMYNKEMYPNIYNKEVYPTIYNKEMYPTVYNKEFQNFEVPSKTVMNEDILRPIYANTIARDAAISKAMIGDKTYEQNKVIPEQMIKV